MKKENGFWIDENNNSWDGDFYTKKQAVKNSESLIDSSYCRNCRDCSYCSYCRNCRDCSDCSYCRDCCDCSNCNYCRDCFDYKKTPIAYTTKKIGSRYCSTRFYYDGVSNIQVVCGCFRGNLEEFEKAVKETHGDNEYAHQYMTEIQKVKLLFDL